MKPVIKELSYFPGCSLATTAKENDASLKRFLAHFNIRLHEIEDWNCCGSSSTHSIDTGLALSLASRNLFLAAETMPLLVACPGCYLRLNHARITLEKSQEKRTIHERLFSRTYPENLQLLHFFELLAMMNDAGLFSEMAGRLNGLKAVPYYGCMLARPPSMKTQKNHSGLIESLVTTLGGQSVRWPFLSRCCGTFLSVSKPEAASALVNTLMKGAIDAGAECLVTACAMCHLNLEIRCSRKNQLPVFHFSELLAIASRQPITGSWFKRHLIDPEPLLNARKLLL